MELKIKIDSNYYILKLNERKNLWNYIIHR